MEKYVPDIYKKDIYSINYDNLVARGIKYLFFDLDNTIAPIFERSSNEEVRNLFKYLKSKNFKITIVSNSLLNRVRVFADELKVDYICNAKKPSPKKIMDLINKNKYAICEIAIIGDSMMDDIVAGNKIGITTILTDQLTRHEFPFAKIKRIREKRIQKKLRDNSLFTKGRYYE